MDVTSLVYAADAKLECTRSASSANGLDEVSKLYVLSVLHESTFFRMTNLNGSANGFIESLKLCESDRS